MHSALSKAAFDRDIARLDPRALQKWGWTIIRASYPTLDVLFGHATADPLRIRMVCPEWDELPPSIELMDTAGKYLTTAPPNVGGVFNPTLHPLTGRPFVCMRGAREYHTHPSHTTDLWDNYRGKPGMDLSGIMFQLWRAWKKAVK